MVTALMSTKITGVVREQSQGGLDFFTEKNPIPLGASRATPVIHN